MTDYTKLTAQEAIELAKVDNSITFSDAFGRYWTAQDILFEYSDFIGAEPFSAHKLVPYGEVKE